MKRASTVSIIAIVAVATAGLAWGEELTLGIATEPTSIDPNFSNLPQNKATGDHWAEPLVLLNNMQQPTPSLAVSWGTLPGDDTVWEFKLRKGVKFTDGTPFTADDVLFTQTYVVALEGAINSGVYWKNKKITKVDDHTIHVTTGELHPLMVKEMAMINILSRKNGEGKTTADYNTGKATIGTGPYKFVEWVQGERVVFEPNPDYWGAKPKWSKATFRPINSDPSRLAALLSGAVDIIDFVPTTDIAGLRTNPEVALTEMSSNRVIMMIPDIGRHVTPFAKANDGSPLARNPLREWRVRRALSLAIDRNAIVERVMEGVAIPAGQMSPPFIFGHNPSLKPDRYDPEEAKRLLTSAGYPDGFRLTIHGPNDRYVNDEKILATLAQMFARVGIKTEVVTQPKATFFTRAKSGGADKLPEFTLFMIGSGSVLGDGGEQLHVSHVTSGVRPDMGWLNHGRYSNPLADLPLMKQSETVDLKARERLIQEAIAIVMHDDAMIPLHYQMNVWAHRTDLAYAGDTNEKTKAMLVSKK